MEEHHACQGPEQVSKCRDTRTFDRFLLVYFLGIVAVSFYALMSQ